MTPSELDQLRELLTIEQKPPPRTSWWRRLFGPDEPADRSPEGSRSEAHGSARLQPSDEIDDVLETAGMIAWAWDPGVNALVPAMAAGYPDRVLAQLPMVARDADNATAAAFRSGTTCAVPGVEGGNGALAVPIMRGDDCTGVLAVELPAGAETSVAMRAATALVARQIGRLVDFTRLSPVSRYTRSVLRRA